MSTLEQLVLVIAICQGLAILGLLALIGTIIWFGVKLSKQVQPAMSEVKRTIENVNRVAVTVGSRVEDIASTGDHMVHDVSKKVEHTASMLQEMIESPLVKLASATAGISKGFEAWSRGSKAKGGDGRG